MSNSTSIGRGPAHGSNENHDGDPRHTTLGEAASQEDAPVGNDLVDDGLRSERPGDRVAGCLPDPPPIPPPAAGRS